MVEFGCDRSDPGEVITLSIRGLQEALDSANLKLNSKVATPVDKPRSSPAAAPPRPVNPAPLFADSDRMVRLASDSYHIDQDLLPIVLNVGAEFKMRPISPQNAARHLRELMERYNFDLVKALAAYKVGPEPVDKYSGVPPDPETRRFVARVVHEYNKKKIDESNQPNASIN